MELEILDIGSKDNGWSLYIVFTVRVSYFQSRTPNTDLTFMYHLSRITTSAYGQPINRRGTTRHS